MAVLTSLYDCVVLGSRETKPINPSTVEGPAGRDREQNVFTNTINYIYCKSYLFFLSMYSNLRFVYHLTLVLKYNS